MEFGFKESWVIIALLGFKIINGVLVITFIRLVKFQNLPLTSLLDLSWWFAFLLPSYGLFIIFIMYLWNTSAYKNVNE